jgi:hypothetical protein
MDPSDEPGATLRDEPIQSEDDERQIGPALSLHLCAREACKARRRCGSPAKPENGQRRLRKRSGSSAFDCLRPSSVQLNAQYVEITLAADCAFRYNEYSKYEYSKRLLITVRKNLYGLANYSAVRHELNLRRHTFRHRDLSRWHQCSIMVLAWALARQWNRS